MNSKAIKQSINYLDSWLQYRYERSDIPGFSIAIAHEGKIVFKKAYGLANIEKKTKLTPEHIFRIASHSKTYTATAIMQLQEQDKLKIDDYVIEYIPWLKQHTDKRWRKVTIRQLLSHRAGVIRDGLNSDYWSLYRPFPSQEELQTAILETQLIFDTNVKMKYSNYGYSILGLVIENASKMPYNDYVTKHIIKPLHLKNTFPEVAVKQSNKFATGYSRADVNKKRLPIDHADTHAMSAATGFCATAEDLCLYASAHFTGTGLLLNDESKKEMQREQTSVPNSAPREHYGLGFDISHAYKRRIVGHSGGFPGYITQTIFDSEAKLAISVLTNSIDTSARYICLGTLSVLDWFGTNYVSRPKRDLAEFEGRYASLWAITDIVSCGNTLAATSLNSWEPFQYADILEYKDTHTLSIKKTSGYSSAGEQIRYTYDKKKPTRIVYAGSTMLPYKEWQQIQSKLNKISLHS